MGGAVRPRQVSLRAHLDETRSGALELLRLEASVRAIKRLGLGFRRGDELHVQVVERVYEDDEPLGGIAPLEGEDWETVENDGVVLVRDAQIIGGGERFLTGREN